MPSGNFLKKPIALPPLPIVQDEEWNPISVSLDAGNQFPLSGGTHPWADGCPVPPEHTSVHREEVDWFAERVADGEVQSVGIRCRELAKAGKRSEDFSVRDHTIAIETAFSPGSC